MKNIANIKVFVLLALRRTNGQPLAEDVLIQTVKLSHPALSDDEVRVIISDLESEGYISGSTDDLTETRLWTLTVKGIARATQLR